MKKILFLAVIALLFVSCGPDYWVYELKSKQEIPDSLQSEYVALVTKLSGDAHPAHLTGKSRDFGQIVREAKATAFDLYAVNVEGLSIHKYVVGSGSYNWQWIPADELSELQKDIFEYVKKNGTLSIPTTAPQRND